MYVASIPNRNSPPAVLLRESWREGKTVKKRTIANISKWPKDQISALKKILKGQKLVSIDDTFSIEESIPHGHVEAVIGTLKKIGLDKIISSRASREKNLVIGMIAQQIIRPTSKLGDTRLWNITTLSEILDIEDADENELYAALDWLLKNQSQIEKNLAKKHLEEGSCVFYDITNSYYEGKTCSLAQFGNGKDGKKGLPVIVYGTMADEDGRPISVQVYTGNTGDCSTIPDQVKKIRESFKLNRIVLVGDRGMLTQTKIDYLKRFPGIGWISALKSASIRDLLDDKYLNLSLFDTRNIAEISSPDFPDERLIACYNPLLADERKLKREALIVATEKRLEKIKREVERRTKKPLLKTEIALKVGKVINIYKMKKHYILTIEDGQFEWQRDKKSIQREQELDGIYIIRTSESKEKITKEDTVRQYKTLAQVERIYKGCKSLDILIRPIRHRLARRVRAHIFMCMLSYYVKWHMRKALAPLLYEDEEIEKLRKTRDPVTQAEPSDSAKAKKKKRITTDGLPVHSFRTLLETLGTRCKNRCRLIGGSEDAFFIQYTKHSKLQKKAFGLLGLS